jgi:peroxiredoxin
MNLDPMNQVPVNKDPKASVAITPAPMVPTSRASTPGVSTPGASTPGASTPGASTPGVPTPGASTPGVPKQITPHPASGHNPSKNLKLTPWQRVRARLSKPASVEVPSKVAANVRRIVKAYPQEDNQYGARNTINGELTTIPIPELLPFLHGQRQTGSLRLHFEDSRLDSQFYFVGGKLSYVRTPFAPGLGNMLQRLKLNAEDLGNLRRYLKADPQERLNLRPHIDMASLEDVIYTRLMMALLPLFYTDAGRFSFQRMEQGWQFTDKLFDAQMLCFQVAQRLEHVATLGASTLTPDNIFHVVQDVGDFTTKTNDFTMLEWRVLASLFKPKMLLTLALELNLGWDNLLETVLLLEQRGILEQHTSSDLPNNLPQLSPGQVAPMFSLPTISKRLFSLGELRGQHTVLIFFRHASARICSAHVVKLSQHADRLAALGVNVVAVFTATSKNLRTNLGYQEFIQTLPPYHATIGQASLPPITLLADADNSVHKRYKIAHSQAGLLDPRNLSALVRGIYLTTRAATAGKDTHEKDLPRQRSQMPATFFIGPSLRIERAFYGTFASDHVNLQQIEAWLEASD